MRAGAAGLSGKVLCAVALAGGLLALAGCGGGGGGGGTTSTGSSSSGSSSSGSSSSGSSGSSSSGSSSSGSSGVAAVTIGQISINAPNPSPLLATTSANFNTALIIGTVFPLTQAVLVNTTTSTTDVTAASSPATLTVLGVESNGSLVTTGPTLGLFAYRLTVPGLPLGTDAKAVLPHDGTVVTLSDGSQASLNTSTLTYTQLGNWVYAPVSGGSYFGTLVTGFQTPTSGVPTTGTATYLGGGSLASGVSGTVFVPDGSGGIRPAALSGLANVGINFGTGAVTGALTSMTATASGVTTPWNNVSLTGTMSGATLSGTTAAGATPSGSGSFGLSSAATGKFSGALYGPAVQELGAIWSLNDTGGATNGKAAVGTIGAIKQ